VASDCGDRSDPVRARANIKLAGIASDRIDIPARAPKNVAITPSKPQKQDRKIADFNRMFIIKIGRFWG
jgi:hypothetical protein